ncbi:uncharacterized protein LOC143446054 [Clavelina lepadiformis]|uniref:Uncharacterized protein n=1 Tax=Clavelina lepadiformis TaxID=159417 RepID=A0ABP0GTP8_CLALP
MEVQNADKIACSSKDLVTSVAKKLKFYVEVKRREDGFDTSPSYLPRRGFPKLLPRPMLMQSPQDVSLRHHFTHAQIRSALGRIQSYKHSTERQNHQKRGKEINTSLRKVFQAATVDHPMWNANQTFSIEFANAQPSPGPAYMQKKSFKPLRSAVRTIRRAPPPSISDHETKRLMDASWKLILDTEVETARQTKKYLEMGNTKLQSIDTPRPLQRQYVPNIHKKYAAVSPRIKIDSFAESLTKTGYVYDHHGRRHRLVFVKNGQAPQQAF